MYPHGIVYQKGKSGRHSEFRPHPSRLVKFGYHFLRILGSGLVTFAIVGVIFSFWPIASEEIKFRLGKSREPMSGFGELINKSMAQSYGLDPYFSLNIPKINSKANIIPNVDPGDFGEYSQALKQGVAQAKGTGFPGQGKTIFLFSHSTDSPLNFNRYNAVFYLLRKLEVGDRIMVYFLDQTYTYQVTQKIITEVKDTSWLRDQGEGERLILQTCDPPGTSLRRLLIIAWPV